MKYSRIFITVSLLLAVLISCSNPPKSEWEILKQEVEDYLNDFELDSAYFVAQKALEVAETDVGPDHSNLIYSLNSLAWISTYQLTDPPPDKPYDVRIPGEQAELLFTRALQIAEEIMGTDHLDVAPCLYNLAHAYYLQGHHADAQPLYERAVSIYEKANGPNHPSVATALHGLARFHIFFGRYEQAEPLYQRALSIREDSFKSDDSVVTTSLGVLGWNYYKQEKYAEAEPLLERALDNEEKILDPDDYRLAQSMTALASNYLMLGKYIQAEPLYKNSVTIWEMKEGPEDNRVAKALTKLADLYRMWKNFDKAERIYNQAMSIYDKMYANSDATPYWLAQAKKSWDESGMSDPDRATTLHGLAEVYRAQGRYEKAEPFYDRALLIWENHHLPYDLYIAIGLKNLAQLYRATDRRQQADSLEYRAENLRKHADSLLIIHYERYPGPMLR